MSVFPLLAAVSMLTADAAWPGFRGTGDSVSTVVDLPLEWSDDKGVAWTAPLDGYGQSSPIVWNNRAFVTSARGENKEELLVACYDVATGKRLWQHATPATNKVPVSDYVSRSAPTPAVDAARVYAFFESGDLVALDHDGNPQWRRNLTSEYGEYKGNHGLGGSPALHGDALVVLVDHDGPSYLLALDAATGKNRWKIDRPSKISWSSPIVARSGGKDVVLVSSNGSVEEFDLADGKRLWLHEGIEGNTVASPTPAGELVIAGSSDVKQTVALRPGNAGDVTVAWRANDAATSFSSALVHRGRVYLVNKAGAAFCLNLADGASVWTERLPGSCWASPLAAGDRVYFFGKDGFTTVVAAEPEFKTLAENRLTVEGRVYGVAAVPGALLLRTGEKLVCVGKP
jgi:outer membrane protein assembly factor BamB